MLAVAVTLGEAVADGVPVSDVDMEAVMDSDCEGVMD